MTTEARSRKFGQDRGRFTVPEDFDAPLPEDVLRSFEESEALARRLGLTLVTVDSALEAYDVRRLDPTGGSSSKARS